MTVGDRRVVALRAAALLTLALLVTAALATILYPLVAGALRLGMQPGTTRLQALTAWTEYVMGSTGQPGRWLVPWTNLRLYLTGAPARDPLTFATTSQVTLGLAGGLGVLCAAGTAYRLWGVRPAQPAVARKRLRGANLVARANMPAFTAVLAADSLHPRDDRQRRREERALLSLKPSRREVRAILDDAREQGRTLTAADASADAVMILIGDRVAQRGLVRLAGVPMPPKAEVSHTLICASTGTGKTVALRQLLGDIRRRGDRAIVLDAGYDLSPAFRRDGDLLLSSTDPASLGWDLRNEIRSPAEWARFVASVVPASGSGDAGEWVRKAQAFLTAICEQVGTETTNAELLKIATSWSTDALAEILAGTPAASLLAEGGDRYLVSVRNNLAEKLASWRYGRSGDFSLRSYMTSDDPRWLWLPYRDVDKGVLGPAIAAWVDLLVLAGLERSKEEGTQRTWIIIDELDSIGTIGSLKEAVTRLRKSNVAVVAAIQDLSQLTERYGRDTAQTLFSSFTNRLYLRCNSSELAETVSKELGEAEFEETRTQTATSLNRQPQNRTSRGQNTSLSSQYTRSPLQLPTEIRNLPTRTGFVTFGGLNHVLPVNLPVGFNAEG